MLTMSANNAGPSSSFTSASFSSYRLLPRAVCASQKRERRERRRRRRRRVNPRFNLRRDTKIRGRVARITRILFSRPHRYENRSFFHLDRIFPIRIVSRIVRDRIFSRDEIRISYRRTVVASWLDPSAAILRWSRDKTRSSSTSFFFPPWSVPNHCYYERSPVRTRAFFSFVHPPSCIPPDALSLYVPSIL